MILSVYKKRRDAMMIKCDHEDIDDMIFEDEEYSVSVK